jgi:hypothetical protein
MLRLSLSGARKIKGRVIHQFEGSQVNHDLVRFGSRLSPDPRTLTPGHPPQGPARPWLLAVKE